MKICHLINNFYPAVGGIEIQIKNLSEGLAFFGHSNYIFTKRFNIDLKKYEELNRVNIHRRILPANYSNFIFRIFGALLNCFLLIGMRDKYQIIHLKAPFIEFIVPCWILRNLFGKKVVYSLSITDELSSFRLKKMFFFQLLIKKMLIFSFDSLVTMSTDLTKDAIIFGIPSNKITFINNGIESDRFIPMPSKKVAGRVIFVGRIDPQKGVDVLLKAWKKIINKGYKYNLCMAGSIKNGKYAEKLHAYINNNNLQKTLIFKGEINYYSDELIDFFQSGDVFVLPSKREGMPAALLQAMSCGLPIITTRVSGAVDLVLDNINGKIVDVDDEIGIANAIIEMVSLDIEEKAKIRKLNRKIIIDNFDMKKRIESYSNLFKNVLEKGNYNLNRKVSSF